MYTTSAPNVNNLSTPSAGHNGITAAEWIHAVLHSGQVTRIGQHLALVLYFLSDAETNAAKVSARDLERITGWGRTAIIDHLSELEIFIRVTWGRGRGKSQFDLQGVIANVVQEELCVRDADIRTRVNRVAVLHPTRISVRQADETKSSVREADARTDTTADTTVSVRVAVATADTKPAEQKKNPPTPPLKKITLSKELTQSSTIAAAVISGNVAAATVDLGGLSQTLLETCNGAIANPAACPGLLSMGTPLSWIEMGCDLTLDIVPTLKALSHRQSGKGISTWDYYTRAVLERRDKRVSGVKNTPRQPGTHDGGPTLRERLKRNAEAIKGGR